MNEADTLARIPPKTDISTDQIVMDGGIAAVESNAPHFRSPGILAYRIEHSHSLIPFTVDRHPIIDPTEPYTNVALLPERDTRKIENPRVLMRQGIDAILSEFEDASDRLPPVFVGTAPSRIASYASHMGFTVVDQHKVHHGRPDSKREEVVIYATVDSLKAARDAQRAATGAMATTS